MVVSNYSVLSTPTMVADKEPTTCGLIIQNVGANDIWIGGDVNVVAGPTFNANRGILLKGGVSPPASYSDVTATGPIYAVAAGGQTGDVCVARNL
jgi:hypothetical protein